MWLALLSAVIANNVIGMLWYSPLMFMSIMVETMNINPNEASMSMGIVLGCNILVHAHAH